MEKTEKNKLKIEGAIFDLDGTLLDSSSVWLDFAFRFFDGTGITPPVSIMKEVHSLTLRDAAEYCIRHYGIPETAEELMEKTNRRMVAFYRDRAETKPGVVPFLREMKRRGVRMCIASATDITLCRMGLERVGLGDVITEIYTCTDTGLSKTTPALFEFCREKMGTPRETTFVFEDACHAVETAKKGGFGVVGVSDPIEEKRRDRIKAASDLFLENFVGAENCFSCPFPN